MKIKEGFRKREVCGENIITSETISRVNFNKMIVLNKSAALLWDNVQGKDFTVEDLRDILLEHYEVEADTALADAAAIADQWKEAGLVI